MADEAPKQLPKITKVHELGPKAERIAERGLALLASYNRDREVTNQRLAVIIGLLQNFQAEEEGG